MKTHPQYEPWLQGMLIIAKHYRLDFSAEHVRVTINHESQSPRQLVLEEMARQLGLGMRMVAAEAVSLDPWRLPLLAEFTGGQIAVINRMDSEGNVSLQFSGDAGLETTLTRDELGARLKGLMVLRPLESTPDARVDDYIKPYEKNWFWQLALKDWRRYSDIMLVALVANVLALSGMVFSMQVYDRVVPSQSEATLWVLFGGVMSAIVFEFIMRMLRVHISDVVGKRADLRISERVFAHALRIKNGARSKSTGSFIAQIRELESVRELITSTTIAAISDLPFFLLFVFILWMIGGPLVLVVLLAVPLLLIPGLLVQRPLGKLSSEGMRESAIRNATLVEAVQGIEDIKLMRAEQRFQNQWNNTNDVAASVGMKQRWLTGLLLTWTQEVQSIVYAVVLLVGCYLVISGDMTTGALVGTSILASRTIAPLSQISGVLSRWQSAKVARKGLDDLMQRPIDDPQHGKKVHKAHLRGDYALEDVGFYYDEEEKLTVLNISKLQIRAGERVAVLGRNGSGKSTLLQLLAGMQEPQQGSILLDDIALNHLDPADLRRDMQLLSQQARLFFGSVRDNILMGNPLATDDEIHQALVNSGALEFVRKQKMGLNYIINEGGAGLSGGQRQALLLARALITSPTILLLDEPTAWLDEMSEKQFIQHLHKWLGKRRTLVVATHRLPILDLVDRIIVLENGKVVMDGPRDAILHQHGMAPQKAAQRTVTMKPAAVVEEGAA
ncbi:TPA: type I secretion system permease/ATPase [Enterobacter asburiae]|jgi:ATP-binding cassette subfamily C protein LapB|uniref:type I secretion system permease/ATPase n=1 Tax=Enterobacter TaxID=547 RepID=UPI0015F3668C|nr:MULTISPECIES: type I secretion system permease/ATPase [Enterobacter]EKS7202134.1 type I secretion system permease/ATPase [Enterobacter asburiae]ELQ7876381.1 type I secretion system permease/ATPase [Enterobacter asburiae]ELR9542124.1 type I secretion system permease/ATPase [Enterobacter asburiae]MDW3570337.1 type I secretion system permease/ATPase [Enterobacter asburiae]MDZ5637747.1 type I secretion system permease/ATPase [Enterobacter sp. A103]